MMEAFEDGFDNCIMRNKESEEGRQIKFSWEDDKDEKKKTCIGSCGWNGIILYDSKVCGLNFFLFFQVVSYYIYLNLSTQRKRI